MVACDGQVYFPGCPALQLEGISEASYGTEGEGCGGDQTSKFGGNIHGFEMKTNLGDVPPIEEET